MLEENLQDNVLCTLNRTTLKSIFMNMLIEIQRPNIFNFKAFGMINLHYEIIICQKIYNRVIMTVYIKCVVRFNVHKTLDIILKRQAIKL